jgi:hypothetical protein
MVSCWIGRTRDLHYLIGCAYDGFMNTTQTGMTDSLTIERDAFTKRIEELRAEMPVREFIHADGSHTFIVHDTDPEHANPRDCDGNVARLVQCHRDYIMLDDWDTGIMDAIARWGYEDAKVRRYVAMFRPDVAYYVDRWEVTGSSQGDWQWGWGYVLVDDIADLNCTAEEAFDAEFNVYQQWFAGEVYGAIHVSQGKEVVTFGDHGAYVDGYEVDEDSCWGFLAYPTLEDIAAEVTSSPITDTHY